MAEVELLDGVRALPRDEWNALVGDESPFLEWEWLASLEESGLRRRRRPAGRRARSWSARAGGSLAACPLYVKAHSEGEFVFDWGWADAAAARGHRLLPEAPGRRAVHAGHGRALPHRAGRDRARRLRARSRARCASSATRNELSGVHVNFCREDERAALAGAGFLPRLGFQYHWTQRRLRDASTTTSARSAASAATRCGASGASSTSRASRIEALTGDAIPDALVRADVPHLPRDRRRSIPGAGAT